MKILKVADRRQFTKESLRAAGGVALGSSALISSTMSDSTANAQTQERQTAIVFVFMRGGADGLSIVPPHANQNNANYAAYLAARPGLRVENPTTLNGQFDLHPACRRLAQMWRENQLLFVHGAGSINGTRSHFEQQDLVEFGMVGNKGGYLNRLLQRLPDNSKSIDLPSASVSTDVAKSLYGLNPAMAVPNLATSLSNGEWIEGMPLEARLRALFVRQTYDDPTRPDNLLKNRGNLALRSLSALETARKLDDSRFSPLRGEIEEAAYHYAGHTQFQTAARLLVADPALRVVTLDVGGWDTHFNMGVNEGTFFNKLSALDRALGAFAEDLQRAGIWNKARVVVMSEFGRPLQQNGTMGLDHGRGGLMMVMGGAMAKRKIVATRNFSLQRNQLVDERDIAVNVDYRDVMGELFVNFMGVPRDALINANNGEEAIFPGYRPNFVGIA